MNKKTRMIILISLVSLLIFSTVGIASANAPVKGVVIAVDDSTGTVTVSTKNGVVFVTLPFGYDTTAVSEGNTLMAKGIWQSETEFTADWVKVFPPKGDKTGDQEFEDEGEESEKEEKQFNSAYCTGEKEGFHPLAEKLAENYGDTTGVTAEQVQEWYCQGYSIGHIMLALLTEKMDGSPAADTLAEISAGKSWGLIWKEKGLIGNEKDGMPPGLMKKTG